MYKNKKIGLALGGGGARGIAHIGVLKVLEKEGIKPDCLAGTSMGALIGAFWATGMNVADIEELAMGFDRKKALKEIVDLSRFKFSIIKGIKIKNFLEKYIGDKTFADTKMPFRILATKLTNGEEVIIDKGSLVDAIMASICLPGVFPAYCFNNEYYIDGGVTNPTPVDVIEEMGADVVIGVDLIKQTGSNIEKPTFVSTLFQTYEIIRTQAVKHKFEKVGPNTVIIEPHLRAAIDSFKFYDINKFIGSGEEAAKAKLEDIKKLANNKLSTG